MMTHFPASSDRGGAGRMAGIHLLSVDLSDGALAAKTSTTWRCSRCGHLESRDDPSELRLAACWHAKEHAEVLE